MRNFFTIIGEAWDFASKQPALFHVALWLLCLPLLGTNVLARIVEMQQNAAQIDVAILSLSILGLVVFSVLLVWGGLCVLIIGKRLLASKAGRTRSSFSAVAGQARILLIPYILTSILRGVTTLLWSILLIIPGVIYSIRTVFFSVLMVTEDAAYRPALRKSIAVVRGRTWRVFWMILAFSIVLFFPVQILLSIMTAMAPENLTAGLLIDLVSAILTSVSTVLFTLCIILLYGDLVPSSPQRG